MIRCIYLYFCLSIYVSINQYIYLFIYLSMYLSTYLSIYGKQNSFLSPNKTKHKPRIIKYLLYCTQSIALKPAAVFWAFLASCVSMYLSTCRRLVPKESSTICFRNFDILSLNPIASTSWKNMLKCFVIVPARCSSKSHLARTPLPVCGIAALCSFINRLYSGKLLLRNPWNHVASFGSLQLLRMLRHLFEQAMQWSFNTWLEVKSASEIFSSQFLKVCTCNLHRAELNNG